MKSAQNTHFDNSHRFEKEGACDHCETDAKIFIELRDITNKLAELKKLCIRHWCIYYDPNCRNRDALAYLIDWNAVFRENKRLTDKYNPDPFEQQRADEALRLWTEELG